jgi:hypothetical protein
LSDLLLEMVSSTHPSRHGGLRLLLGSPRVPDRASVNTESR